MTLAVVIESAWQATALAPWAARLARGRGDERVLFLITSAAKGRKKAEARKAAAKAAERRPATQAVKEAVGAAAGKVKEAVDEATDEAAPPVAVPEPEAADREPQSPLEAAVRGALARAEREAGELVASVETVEVSPAEGGDPAAGLEDLLARLAEEDASLLLLSASESRRDDSPLTDRLFGCVRCAVAVVRPPPGRSAGAEDANPRPADTGGRILVPTAGGPHATLALRLAVALAEATGDRPPGGLTGVDAFYVQKDVGPESRGLGQRKVRAAVRKALAGPLGFPAAGADAGGTPGEIVRVGENYPRALSAAVAEGRHGVVMVGAADRVQARRALFSGLPDDLLRDRGEDGRGQGRGVTLLVVREEEAFAEAAGRLARGVVRRWIPQLDREGRISLVERIEGPSRWSTDFVALMILSTAIATFGEMQDSTAVVIGAMLVAPLMTPLVGCGLAVVQGNNKLVRGSVRSVLLGFLVAFATALLMGLLIPFPGLTSEVLARGTPTLLDLGVALVSGVAAAYAVARPNLSGALPGVAIAAALVPPIAAAGISFGSGAWWIGLGATLLFSVNVLAIILGAAIALLAVGVEGRHEHKSGGRWRPHAFGFLGLGCLVLAVPLTWTLLRAMPPEGVPQEVEELLAEVVARGDNGRLVSVEGPFDEAGAFRVEVLRSAGVAPRDGLADELARTLADHYGREVSVHVRTDLSQQSGQSGEAR